MVESLFKFWRNWLSMHPRLPSVLGNIAAIDFCNHYRDISG